ncbi:MAG: hypothetical protein PVS3B3_19550 [Ktedonobacteraceae bacterium]
MFEQLTLLVVAIAGLPVSGTVIAVAGVVLALVVAIGGFLVYRSGGKKGTKAATGTGNNDWQRQTQQPGSAAGGWSPQGPGNDAQQPWSQQQAQGQQAGWGTQNNVPPQQGWNTPQGAPMQQQGANSWGGQNGMPQSANAPWNEGQGNTPQQPAWGGGLQNGQQTANPWATPGNPGTQPAPVNQWGASGNPVAQPTPVNQWDAQGGGQGGRQSWDAQPAPVAQEPWGQPAQQWSGQANPAPQSPLAPTALGGGMGSGPSWNQQGFGQNGQNAQGADAWGTPQQQQHAPQNASNALGGFAGAIGSVPQAPAWQQQQVGFGQGVPGMQQNQGASFDAMNNGFGANDSDKTIMRSIGGLGLVRVEEGKEPGREYKIVKESLSIGRSRESDIFLEDLAVSRLHASVVNLGNGQYALKDEGSANGTKVNGQLVNKFQTFPLQEGDRIQLGQTVLVFARG